MNNNSVPRIAQLSFAQVSINGLTYTNLTFGHFLKKRPVCLSLLYHQEQTNMWNKFFVALEYGNCKTRKKLYTRFLLTPYVHLTACNDRCYVLFFTLISLHHIKKSSRLLASLVDGWGGSYYTMSILSFIFDSVIFLPGTKYFVDSS